MARRGWRRFSPRLKSGFASRSEEKFEERLTALGVPHSYETTKVKFQPKVATYLTDFQCPGFIIEYKGYFESADRTKHLLIKAQHPDLDIRFVFQRAANTITKTSKTTYGQWASKHGFLWSDGDIPDAWVTEAKQNAANPLFNVAGVRGQGRLRAVQSKRQAERCASRRVRQETRPNSSRQTRPTQLRSSGMHKSAPPLSRHSRRQHAR